MWSLSCFVDVVVYDKFFWMFGDVWIEVVLDYVVDCFGLLVMVVEVGIVGSLDGFEVDFYCYFVFFDLILESVCVVFLSWLRSDVRMGCSVLVCLG